MQELEGFSAGTSTKALAFGQKMFTNCCSPLLPFSSNGKAKLLLNDISADELTRLHKIFDMLDVNRDGFLTLEDLSAWMKKVKRPITKAGLLKILKDYDGDNDGSLDFEEFVAFRKWCLASDLSGGQTETSLIRQRHLNKCDDNQIGHDLKGEMKEAFEVFDKDGNGLISPTELRATLCELGLLPSVTSLSRIQSMIRRVDTDGDGHVNFSEFENMMNGK